jgi:CRISPR-associated protein Cas1
MGERYYIFKNCDLKRKDNRIVAETADGQKKDIKIELTKEIYLFGEVNLNTKLLTFLGQNKIILHVFNYYGFYSGSYYPKEVNVSGYLLVNQVKHYDDSEKRSFLAKEFINCAADNIYRNLRYYKGRGKNLEAAMGEVESLKALIEKQSDVKEIMGIEGNIRKVYYRSWNEIVNQEIDFHTRVKRPPDNMINSLISFINSLMYTTVLSQIYETQLNPTISYLHEPSTRRFSLCLDIAEVFKPLICDRLIFSLLNKNQINEGSFEKESNFTYLKEKYKQVILREYDERLDKTIKHKGLGRNVSYRHLIKLECYKLIKHLIGEQEYEGFRIWW